MLKSLSERTQPCLPPTVVGNHSLMLPSSRTALVALSYDYFVDYKVSQFRTELIFTSLGINSFKMTHFDSQNN